MLSGAGSSCQHVLQAAAVIGLRFDVDLLAAVVGAPALACIDLLAEAQRLGVTEPDGGPHRHRFVNAETHERVLGTAVAV